MANTYDNKFSELHVPPPISSVMGETYGFVQIDACGRNALSCEGDLLLDGKITTTDLSAPSISIRDGVTVNISGTLNALQGVQFTNVSDGTIFGVPFSRSQPHIGTPEWCTDLNSSGILYTTMVRSALGAGYVKVLCIS